MTKVYLDYNGELYHWLYYFYDSENYKVTTEGFKNHIVAKEHATKSINNSIQFINK